MLTPATAARPSAREAAPSASPDQLAYALEQALIALGHESAVEWLQAYYDPAGNYAGNSFLAVAPNDPWAITATDLYAISLLTVQVWPRSARKLLESEQYREAETA
jgi:hypothetical protein